MHIERLELETRENKANLQLLFEQVIHFIFIYIILIRKNQFLQRK